MSLNGNLNKSQFMEELQQKVEHINDVHDNETLRKL